MQLTCMYAQSISAVDFEYPCSKLDFSLLGLSDINVLEEKLYKSSVQLRIDLKKGQKQGRNERMPEDYTTVPTRRKVYSKRM